MMKKYTVIAALLAVLLAACSASGVDLTAQYARVTTAQGPLNMRKTASSNAALLDKIPKDTILAVSVVDDTWCRCVYQGDEGYVMRKYLTFLDTLPYEALSAGSSGKDVLSLKERLRALHYLDSEAKGGDTYDSALEAAVRSVQKALGLEVTGAASPELQAYLFWGPAEKNGLSQSATADNAAVDPYDTADNAPALTPPPAATSAQKMKVTISASCSNYNHVGNNWSRYYSIDGESVKSEDTIPVTVGKSITVYSKITEKDKSPDAGSANESVEITQEKLKNGFTVTQKVSVKEDKGRYSGNKAVWTVTFKFSPK